MSTIPSVSAEVIVKEEITEVTPTSKVPELHWTRLG
jgi:hypothetical protein